MTTIPSQQRQPAGTPVGGQFAAAIHPDGPDLAPAELEIKGRLDAVIDGKIKDWVEDNLNGYADAELLELLDMDEDQAIEQYGPEIGDRIARMTLTVTSDTVEVSPDTYEGPLAGPAEYDTGGHVMVIDEGRDGERKVVASAMFTGTDPPELPPFSAWVHGHKPNQT